MLDKLSICFFTPSSISNLTMFVFVALATGYLWRLAFKARKRASPPPTTIPLAGTFTGIALYVLFTTLEEILYLDWGFFAGLLTSILIALAMVCLIQFSYRFPKVFPGRLREARVVLGVTLLLPLLEIYYAILRCTGLAQGRVQYRPEQAEYVVAVSFLWLFVVAARQVARADERRVSLWRKLWKPHGDHARAARAFLLICLTPLWAIGTAIVGTELGLGNSLISPLISLGLLFGLLAFGLVYLNHLPDRTSFMVKLVAVTLVLVLGILGTVSHAIIPPFLAEYRNLHLIADRKTLRFEPNNKGGYDVASVPFDFQDDLGTRVAMETHWMRLSLSFDFPYYDQAWREVLLLRDGGVDFGEPVSWYDVQYRYGPNPAIYALGTGLVGSNSLLKEPAGIYVHNAADKLTITWNRLPGAPETTAPETIYTFQLTLFPSGMFEISYDDVPANLNYDIYTRWNTAWMIGALPGAGQTGLGWRARARIPQYVHFNTDLPVSGGPHGLVEDYHLEFRRALRRRLAPLVPLTLLSSAVVVLGLPFVFRHNLVRPLNRLLAGVRQVDAGNLDIRVPVQYDDEIGTLTRSFNTMATQLSELVNDLEGRVAARTLELVASRKEVEATNALLRTVLDNLDTLIYVSDMDTDEILFANEKIQEAFGPIYGRICWQALQDGLTGPCDSYSDPQLILPRDTVNPIHHRELQNTRNGRWYTCADSAVEWIDGRLVRLSMLVDITEIKQTEAQLLAEQVTVTALEERQRLARDLHDSVAQSIHSLVLFSETLGSALDKDHIERAGQLSERLQQSARQALKEMRLMLYELQPVSLKDYADLARALDARLQAVERRAGVEACLVLVGDPAWCQDWNTDLFWMTSEALNNALKHAQASSVRVTLRCDPLERVPARLELMVEDDGVGFDTTRPRAGGMGLHTMAARAETLGGKLVVESSPGQGTRVRFWAEISPSRRRDM